MHTTDDLIGNTEWVDKLFFVPMCYCTTPNQGLKGHNQFKCTNRNLEEETHYCGAQQQCYAEGGFMYGQWKDGCRTPENMVKENANDVGNWGGYCKCPNGEQYAVGDEQDSACEKLACGNGEKISCYKKKGIWSKRKVSCYKI